MIPPTSSSSSSKPRRAGPALLGAAAALFLLLLGCESDSNNLRDSTVAGGRRSVLAAKSVHEEKTDDGEGEGGGDANNRPLMHTFYDSFKTDEAELEGERNLIASWEGSWREAGWETKVLTMEDARLHPKYDEYAEVLESSALSEYNRLCYWRWVAMAAVGGGWMSDFDTFPLRKAADGLSDPGKFTVHDYPTVPCLLSGSQREWDRMAGALLRSSEEHLDDRRWSDMYNLADHHRTHPGSVRTSQDILAAERIWENLPLEKKTICKKARGKMAIHFSHRSINEGLEAGAIESAPGRKKGLQVRLNERGDIAKKWIGDLEKVCGSLEDDTKVVA